MTMLLQEFSAGGVWSSFKHCRLEVGWGWSGKGKTIPSGRGTSDFGGEGDGTPLQYSCLENPMDRGAWEAAVQGVAKSRTRLSDFTLTFHFHALEKEMNGNPLQCSCLENPRDGGAWWAAIYGVTQSRARLK